MMSYWRHSYQSATPRPAGWDRPGLSVADKRRLQELLHQQLWCWGRDVLAQPTNLLIRHGMTRHGDAAPGQRGSNCYSLRRPDQTEILIWAFGLAIRTPTGGIFLHRYQRGPRLLPHDLDPSRVREPGHLPPLPRPRAPNEQHHAVRLLTSLFGWIAGYERWVLRTMGDGYRARTLDRWEHPVAAAAAMPDEWTRLAACHRRWAAALSAAALPIVPAPVRPPFDILYRR